MTDPYFPIIIPGTPIPQGSKNVTRTGRMYEANPRHKEWRHHCTTILTLWTGSFFGAWEPYDGPLEVSATFYLPRPKKPRFNAPAVKPDLDKLARSLGDSMTAAGLITDDARITRWHLEKQYGDPSAVIHYIRPIQPMTR